MPTLKCVLCAPSFAVSVAVLAASYVQSLHGQVIDSVEFVQVIQELQSLNDLQNSLTANGQPPVPILADKPASMRIYTKANTQGGYVFGAVLPDRKRKETTVTRTQIPPCAPDEQRKSKSGVKCGEISLQFVPPAGDWEVTLRVLKPGTVVEGPITFKFKNSPLQQELEIIPVTVCDKKNRNTWLCGDTNFRNIFKSLDLLPNPQSLSEPC